MLGVIARTVFLGALSVLGFVAAPRIRFMRHRILLMRRAAGKAHR